MFGNKNVNDNGGGDKDKKVDRYGNGGDLVEFWSWWLFYIIYI